VSGDIAAPGFPILDGLRADGPDPRRRDDLMTFGQFVGVWAMDVRYFDETGETYHGRWEWSFAWVLGGLAIQDVIVVLGSADRPGRRPGGTTIRYLHADSGEWTVFYLGVQSGNTAHLRARPVDDGILIDGPDPDGTLNRWTFSDITPRSFTWTGRESRDGGQTWLVNQRMLATRLR